MPVCWRLPKNWMVTNLCLFGDAVNRPLRLHLNSCQCSQQDFCFCSTPHRDSARVGRDKTGSALIGYRRARLKILDPHDSRVTEGKLLTGSCEMASGVMSVKDGAF